jgi:hypothetical protein
MALDPLPAQPVSMMPSTKAITLKNNGLSDFCSVFVMFGWVKWIKLVLSSEFPQILGIILGKKELIPRSSGYL